MLKVPHIIAICGWPTSGKSAVQDILAEEFGVQFADDGGPLRDFAMRHLGLSHGDVFTQEGKLRTTVVCDTAWQNRKILGELGKRLEEMFGPDIMPYMATRNLHATACYSFGSVRRQQGWFYKGLGGVVVGVRRPGVQPTGNDFDEFDSEAVDFWIDNDGTLDELRVAVQRVIVAAQWTPFSFKLVA